MILILQIDCQVSTCAALNFLPHISSIPKNIDLRELGLITSAKSQGNCFASFAIIMNSLLENAILLVQDVTQRDFWRKNANELSLSTQFLLSNTRGASAYCDGGDAVKGLNYLYSSNITTVELEINFPYKPEHFIERYFKNKTLKPILQEHDWILPFEILQIQDMIGKQSTPIISLNKGGQMDIMQVKQFLARGIAVISSVYTGIQEQQFKNYNGSFVMDNYGCNNKLIFKQVLIVGYGFFKGKEVWIVQNTAGPYWGNHGFFYVTMWNNNMCIEDSAFSILPKYYDISKRVFDSKYESNFNLKRGFDGLDNDDGSFNDLTGLNSIAITMIVIISMVLFSLLMAGLILIISKIKKTQKQSYFKLENKDYLSRD
ncbi:Cathepsin L [Spironucleus salmonicida]|uniref:Cathepsin L n=1 Tax=Spironucleus salmonicida TaxID=348837 RepID=V6LKD6_9EUKA|nr:Cathepsin L [Spironucleus salmonicida]|eukprot:EST45105.1 Cathepsin L [Spironucleus salmonicida]